MKTDFFENQTFGMCQLNQEEMTSIDGGGFWYDVFHVIGVTAKCIKEFCKTASEFQHSLPPNLKK